MIASHHLKTMKADRLPRIYLKCMGYIFAIAFLSYYVQYPALSSRSGIEPSERIFKRAFPRLHSAVVDGGYCDADSFAELVNLLGVVLSVAIARYGCSSSVLLMDFSH